MIAYLVNQYPKVSHSFIRREIASLERQGYVIVRYAIRGWDADLVDPADIEERNRTTYLLEGSVLQLCAPAFQSLIRSPERFFRASRMVFSLSRGSNKNLLYHIGYFLEACRLENLLARSGVNHLHAHFGTNSAEVAMLSHILGGPPYSFTVHGPEEFDRPSGLHLAEKIERAKFVVAVSSYGRSQLYRTVTAAYWPRIKVVHCGLDKSFYEGKAVSAAEGITLVCVGRLCEQKGQLLLLQALKRLTDEGIEADLVLAGDGEMRSEIEALIGELGIEGRVRITGWISSERVREEILASRALVLPSFAEGLPVVVMEAMALKRPVVTTYIAGIPELVFDGEHGWLCPAGSVDALAEAMKACLAAPAEVLAAMGEAGYARVTARHDADTEAAKLARLFEADAVG